MALFEEWAGVDQFDTLEDKFNALVQFLNDKLAGGTAGQLVSKVDGTDFNFQFVDKALNQKVLSIGDWDMVADTFKIIPLGGVDFKKVRSVDVIIRDDADSTYYHSPRFIGAGDNLQIGVTQITSSGIQIERKTSGAFDGSGYDSTGFNRGFITIVYID